MATLSDAFGLMGQMFSAVGETLSNAVYSTLADLQFGQPHIPASPSGITYIEPSDDARKLIMQGILLYLGEIGFAGLVMRLHEQQMQGIDCFGNKSRYKTYITVQKATELGFGDIAARLDNGSGKITYSKFKAELNPLAAGYVDLNLTGELYGNYNRCVVDLERNDKLGFLITFFADNDRKFEKLAEKYGESYFSLTMEGVGLTDEVLDLYCAKYIEMKYGLK